MFRFPHDPTDEWRITCLGNAGFAAALTWEVDSHKE